MDTQPGPPDEHDPAESQGLGPPIRSEPEKNDAEEEWFPSRDHPGFLENRDDPPKLKTNIPPPK